MGTPLDWNFCQDVHIFSGRWWPQAQQVYLHNSNKTESDFSALLLPSTAVGAPKELSHKQALRLRVSSRLGVTFIILCYLPPRPPQLPTVGSGGCQGQGRSFSNSYWLSNTFHYVDGGPWRSWQVDDCVSRRAVFRVLVLRFFSSHPNPCLSIRSSMKLSPSLRDWEL